MTVIKAVGASYTIDKAKAKDCERCVSCDSLKLPLQEKTPYKDHKYGEIVEFKNSTNQNFAICIGLNPKWGREKQFDRSNQKIAGWLKPNYKGFVLLNMFSIVTKDMSDLCAYIASNAYDLQNDMRDVVAAIIQRTSYDIYLFYGENAYGFVNANLANALSSAYQQGRKIFISEAGGRFVHVGSRTCGSRMHANFVLYTHAYKKVF